MKEHMRNLVLLVVGWGALFGGAAYGQFTPGHVYVSIEEFDACDFGGMDAIIEIDPSTGASSIFADSSDGLCLVSGLRFTPDQERLLALNRGHSVPPTDAGSVQSFAPDGTSTIILDESDGIGRPWGANALALNAAADLFVLNADGSGILRFPANGGPGTVFSTISGQGALDFAPNGDLFLAAGDVFRITRDGVWGVFDTLPAATSLVFDGQGNLFVAAGQAGVGTTFYRYDDGDANSRRILASGFVGSLGVPLPITLSPDDSTLYFLEIGGTLYGIDAENGTRTVLADLSALPVDVAITTGITVNRPPPGPVPAVSQWGLVVMLLGLLTAGTLVFLRRKVGRMVFIGLDDGDKS